MLSRWQSTVVDSKGNIQPNAVLRILNEADQTLALVHQTNNDLQPYPLGYVTANANGFAYFYAAPGRYRIQSVDLDIDWRDVEIGGLAVARASLENSGMLIYNTQAEMQADAPSESPVFARVVNDANPDLNGDYIWDGSVWERTTASESADLIQVAVEALQGAVDDLTIKVSQNRTLIDALASPLIVFKPDDFGDFYLLTRAYQNVTGTEPAVVDGDPVALIPDLLGNGLGLSQVTATARPILRRDGTGDYLEFDLGDDYLTIDNLPAGEYSVCLPTREGIYHDTVAHVGGQFDVGPLTYTGGPTDLMLALSDGSSCQMVAPPLLIDRALTATEEVLLNSYYMWLGAGSPEMYGDDMVLFAETTAANETFNIPANNNGSFDASIDWGDGTTSEISAYDDADLTHTYDSPGVHRVRISGQFGNIRYNNEGDRLKVIGYANLGNTGAVTLLRAFRGCSDMRFGLALGNTDTSSVSSFSYFANDCPNLQTLDVSNWDTSSVSNFSFFVQNCSSLTTLDVSGWDTSSVLNFSRFAFNCSSLTGFDPSEWNVEKASAFSFFLSGTNNALSQAKYDATLINWESQNERPNVSVHFGDAQYSAGGAAEAARAALVSNGWVITDGGPAQ